MKTHYFYDAESRQYVRYYYDRSIRSWCWYQVTAPNDEADQTSEAHYAHEKPSDSELTWCAKADSF